MIVKTLLENTSVSPDFGCEHGLSLHIETKKRRILFDAGATSLFAENAKRMGIDLAQVDLAVLSHGHSDHGGGLGVFLSTNATAKVYCSRYAFGDYYSQRPSEEVYAGIDKSLLTSGRFVFAEDLCTPLEGVEFFYGIQGRKFFPSGNKTLLKKNRESLEPDDFIHELNMMVEEDGKTLFVAGCSHCGIVNALEHFRDKKGFMPTHVIAGFHLTSPSTGESETPEVLDQIADFLLKSGAKFYTGHCTGAGCYDRLKAVLGERLELISTGGRITI